MPKPKLARLIPDEILDKYLDEKFSYLNFKHIAEKQNSKINSVKTILKALYDNGCLERVGFLPMTRGGGKSSVYVVKDAEKLKESKASRRTKKEYALIKDTKARYISQCADRLDRAIENWA